MEYPKMLYNESYQVHAAVPVHDHDRARDKALATKIVNNPDEHLEALANGWAESPAGPFEKAEQKPAALQGGPTLEEYVKAGYKADGYPPGDYAEVPSEGLTAYRATGVVPGQSSDGPVKVQDPVITPPAPKEKEGKKKATE